MKAVASHSQFLFAAQKVESIVQDFNVEKAKKIQIDDHSESTPARGVLIGVAGGISLWSVIIWGVVKLF